MTDTKTEQTDDQGLGDYQVIAINTFIDIVNLFVKFLPDDAYSQNLRNVYNQKIWGLMDSWTKGQVSDADCIAKLREYQNDCLFP